MPKDWALTASVFGGKLKSGGGQVESVNGALTVGTASGVVPRIDAELFHSGKESRAVDAQVRGGPIGTPYAPFGFGECAHDHVALSFCILISHIAGGV